MNPEELYSQFPAETLTPAEEVRLSETARAGCTVTIGKDRREKTRAFTDRAAQARDRLALANMSQAIRYSNTCFPDRIEPGERVSLCYEALADAALTFKGGLTFFAFAKPRVRGAFKDFWQDQAIVRGVKASQIEADDFEADSGLAAEAVAVHDPDFVDKIQWRDMWPRIRSVFANTLTSQEWMILELHDVSSYTFKEIGTFVGLTRQAIQCAHKKGLTTLTSAIEKNPRLLSDEHPGS